MNWFLESDANRISTAASQSGGSDWIFSLCGWRFLPRQSFFRIKLHHQCTLLLYWGLHHYQSNLHRQVDAWTLKSDFKKQFGQSVLKIWHVEQHESKVAFTWGLTQQHSKPRAVSCNQTSQGHCLDVKGTSALSTVRKLETLGVCERQLWTRRSWRQQPLIDSTVDESWVLAQQ